MQGNRIKVSSSGVDPEGLGSIPSSPSIDNSEYVEGVGAHEYMIEKFSEVDGRLDALELVCNQPVSIIDTIISGIPMALGFLVALAVLFSLAGKLSVAIGVDK